MLTAGRGPRGVVLSMRPSARQLRRPTGILGYVWGVRMNRLNRTMNEASLAELAIAPGDRVLEAGFGGGSLLKRILDAGGVAAGLDLSPEMVRLAQRRLRSYIRENRLEVRCGSIDALPYEDGSFSKVCSVNTIYFWEEPERALSECRRVLKPGGSLVLCFNSRSDLEAGGWHREGFRLYEVDEVRDLLRAADFAEPRVIPHSDPWQGKFFCVTAGSRFSG